VKGRDLARASGGMVAAGGFPHSMVALLALQQLQELEATRAAIVAMVHLDGAHGYSRVRVNSTDRGKYGWRCSVTAFWRAPGADGEEVTRSRVLAAVEIARNDELLALQALKHALALGGGQV
jgi:hypothetical protein